MKVRFKHFTDGYDQSKFYALMGKFFAEKQYRKELPYLNNCDDKQWIVAMNGKDVAGFVAIKKAKGDVEFSHVYVVPHHRGEGLFEQIANEWISTVKERFPGSMVTVTTNDTTVEFFWLKKGFIEANKRGSYKILRGEL